MEEVGRRSLPQGSRSTLRNLHSCRPICVREGGRRQEHTPSSCAHVWRHRHIPETLRHTEPRHTPQCTRALTKVEPVYSHEHTETHTGTEAHLTTHRYTHTDVPARMPRNTPGCACTRTSACLQYTPTQGSKLPGMCLSLIPALNPRIQGAG